MLSDLRSECIIGRELHEDGGIHYHVFVDFGRLFSSRKTDIFDVGGRHPNIQPARKTPGKMFDYAIKDGDVVAGGLERPGTNSDFDPDDFWASAAHSQSMEEFLHVCDSLAPRDLIRGFTNFRAYANWKFKSEPEPYTGPEGVSFDTSEVARVNEWLHQADLGAGPSRLR